MPEVSRRSFLQTATVSLSGAGFAITAAPKRTDVRIKDIQFSFEDFAYRAPYKFGGGRSTSVRC